jgi:hypothetical protein
MFSTNYDEYNINDFESFSVMENFDRGDLIESIPGPEKRRVTLITSPYQGFHESIEYFIFRIHDHEHTINSRPHAIFMKGLPLNIADRQSTFELWYFDGHIYAVDQNDDTFVCRSS